MNINNPLLNFARKAEMSIKLPSNGEWYTDDIITYNIGGEVDVYPMTAKDELEMLNPDNLLSGQSTINLIQSCVPAIKDAARLLYPDANVLLLAIHAATYGNDLSVSIRCPHCLEIAEKIRNEKNDDKQKNEEIETKLKEMIKNKEICIDSQEYVLDTNAILSSISFLNNEYVYTTKQGLKIYYQPLLLKSKLEYGLSDFNRKKILRYYKDYDFKDYNTDEEKKKILKSINDLYLEMNTFGNKIVANSITKVVLPDGSYVDNKDMIYEFISQLNSQDANQLTLLINEVSDIGLPLQMEYECPYCKYKWMDKLPGFNKTDFFDNSSYF